MIKLIQGFILIIAIALLPGCKEQNSLSDASGSGSSGSSDSATGTDTSDPVIDMGNGSGSSFTADQLAIGVSPLSAGGSTSVTATLVDENGNLYSTDVDVSFSSQCAGLGTATLESPVTSSNGTAISTYVAKGCTGNDTITATATVNGTTLTATGTINVLAPTLGSIEFVSATPEIIALKGTGGAGLSETSTVVFKVLDSTGGPVTNQDVDFTLNTTVGGLSLTPSSATSDANGQVQTVVQSGTIPTPVRITATISGTSPAIATQSDQLTVTTGIPDQNSLSLSASTLNPEAWSYDGETVTITARLADRFNNPVPDGTTVNFTTEGGAIEGSCTTTDGACSVTWTSQDIRPCGQVLGDPTLQANLSVDSCLNDAGTNPSTPQNTNTAPLGQPYGGRATIVATAVGEESFIDANGNGYYDSGESFEDLPEAWRDNNEDGSRDSDEIFFDFDEDGSYDSGDSNFNGILCNANCGNETTLHVRDSLVLVMSGSSAFMNISPASVNIANGGSQTITIIISDLHNQPMPAGTTVAFSTSLGSLDGETSYTYPSTNVNGAVSFSVTLKGAGGDEAETGTFKATVTTPKGIVTTSSIPVTEGAPPATGADLSLSMTDNPDPVNNGNNVTYTITVTNNGPDDASGVVVTDTVPSAGADFVSATPSQGNCFGTDPVTCSLGDISNGANATIDVVFNTTAVGVITNSASVSATEDDPNSGNDSTGQNTTVQ